MSSRFYARCTHGFLYDYKRLAGLATITGGAGVDSLSGGLGDDVFIYTTLAELFDDNALVDSITGGGGTTDTIRMDVDTAYTITAADSWARSNTIEVLSQREATGVAGDISITLNADAFTAGIRTVTLAGDINILGVNTIDASAAIAGQDLTLIGSSSNDSITGGAGNDTITGGNFGSDTITGGLGADTMSGGGGADVFQYSAAAAGEAETGDVGTGVIDVITDFATGVDTITGFGVAGAGEFSTTAGGAGYANYAAALNGANAVIAAFNSDYVLSAYGAGGAWTAVVFIDIGAAGGAGAAAGAIQLSATGAFATEAAALAAAVAADFIV